MAELDLHQLFFQVMRLVRERAHKAQEPGMLFPPEFMALKYFEHHPRTSVSTFADFLHVRKPTATELLKRLIARDLLTRVQSEKDRRSFELELTVEGKKVLERAQSIFQSHARVVFSALSSREQEELSNLLSKVIHNSSL